MNTMGNAFSFSPEMYGTITYDEPNLIPSSTEHDSPQETIPKRDVIDILRKKDTHIRHLEEVLQTLLDVDPDVRKDGYMEFQEQSNGYRRNMIKKEQVHDVVMFVMNRMKKHSEDVK